MDRNLKELKKISRGSKEDAKDQRKREIGHQVLTDELISSYFELTLGLDVLNDWPQMVIKITKYTKRQFKRKVLYSKNK